MIDEREYSLDEISTAADVTPRTVRYYVTEGLLAPPTPSGRTAYYTEEHLDRLRAIAVLKEMFLPLKEIRHRLNTLTREQMRDPTFLATLSQIVAVDRVSGHAVQKHESRMQRAVAEPDSAADYLQRNAPRARPEPRPQQPMAARPAPTSADTWERFQVTRDAELLIRSDRVQRIGRHLRQTLHDIGDLIESADHPARNRS